MSKYIGRYQNLKAELTREGVSQAQVADHFGMSTNNFNLKMNGRVPFTVPEIVEIREVFVPDATLDYLLECEPLPTGGDAA
jgi:transcriptional regulator with XRE-family HTH domain